MHINMTSDQADQLIADRYSGASKPMSKNTSLRNTQSIDWWKSQGKNASITHTRKHAGIDAYLAFASHSLEPLPANTFPAAFHFSDQERRRPDKGIVKAFLRAGHITGQHHNGELIFALTPEGLAQFPGRTE